MIDFQEDKQEIDFQVEGQSQIPMNNNIDFQLETNIQNTNNGIDFQPAKLEGKVEYNEELSPYDMVLRDTKLTKEQKVQKIKEIGEAERKKIDREHRIKMAKLYGGAALEIGSCLIPFGGAANIGGRLALRLAKPAFSQIAKRVIARNVGRGIGSGLASGAMFGAGNGLMEDKDIKGIAQSAVEGAGTGMALGGAIGGVAGKVATKFGRTKEVINKVKRVEENDCRYDNDPDLGPYTRLDLRSYIFFRGVIIKRVLNGLFYLLVIINGGRTLQGLADVTCRDYWHSNQPAHPWNL